MAVPATSLPEARWVCEIRNAETLADDLGILGSWVGPRKGPIKRTQGQKEDYVLRRLLVAWKQAGQLHFPVQVRAEADRPREPDFLFTWKDGRTLGVEVTEAGEEDYQKWLTETEAVPDEAVVDLPFDASTERTVSELVRSIKTKVDKFDEGAYRGPSSCDLVVYDNTSWGGFLDNRAMINALRRPNDLTGRFRQVHIVFGETVYLDVFGAKHVMVDVAGTYEIDYARWVNEQVDRIRRGATRDLDLDHIAEELEDLGKSERRALGSHLRNLMHHLLKWQFQPAGRSNSWIASIANSRTEIHELLTESPSLRRAVEAQMVAQYGRARAAASEDTELSLKRFPEECPYSREQLVDPEYLPNGQG